MWNEFSLSSAESCTGGMLSSTITSVSGASKVFTMGLVTYSNQAKMSILKVTKKIIQKQNFDEVDFKKFDEDSKQLIINEIQKDSLSLSQSRLEAPISLGFKLLPFLSVFSGPTLQYNFEPNIEDVTFSNIEKNISIGIHMGLRVHLGPKIAITSVLFANPNLRSTTLSNPSFCINKGTSYIVEASFDCITESTSTLQKSANLFLISSEISCSVLQTNMSALIPLSKP